MNTTAIATTVNAADKTHVYPMMKEILESKFIRCNEIARILALAVASGTNVLLWGPGGHGKSEMVQEGLSVVADDEDIFVQSFGEGMDEATLWGGLDFAALEQEKILRYFPENSFLAKTYAVFEELFDAPASVLLALKDTLTAKKLRKGSQRFAMKTKVIIALTNKDPKEVADLGPAAAALIERFPLQLRVAWPSYKATDYLELFNKVSPSLSGADLNGTQKVLAEVMARAGEDGGNLISPRTAVHSVRIVKTAAALRGAATVERSDLLDLCFLPGMEGFAANLKAELDAAYERSEAEGRLVRSEAQFKAILDGLEEAKKALSPVKLLQSAKYMSHFADQVANLKVTNEFTERRKRLRDSVADKVEEAKRLAFDNTRL